MIYADLGEVATLHDRASRNVGFSETVSQLKERHLAPASKKLADLATNRVTLAVLKVGRRAFNWDLCGSLAANQESVSRALLVVPALIEQALEVAGAWSDPHVGLNEAGEVSFEWWVGDKKLTLYVAQEATEYVISCGANIDTEIDAGALEAQGFPALWGWLNG